jgi:hypothetical protein
MIQYLEDQRQHRIRKFRDYDGMLRDAQICLEQLQKMADEINTTISAVEMKTTVYKLEMEDFQNRREITYMHARRRKYLRIPVNKLKQRHSRRCKRWKCKLFGVQSKRDRHSAYC